MKTTDPQYIEAREKLIYSLTENILVIMEENNITKVSLAAKINKSPSHVNQILSGKHNMTINTLSDICTALNVHVSDIITNNASQDN